MKSFALIGSLIVGVIVGAQPPQFSTGVRAFIKIDAPVIALTRVRVIDGTGGSAKEDRAILW